MRPPSLGRFPVHGPKTFTLDGTPNCLRNSPASMLVRMIFCQCPRKDALASASSNAGKSISTLPLSFQSAMSNGVAVILASSIHSGSPALGLYITSFTTTCSASAPVQPVSTDQTIVSFKNDFLM